MKTNKFFATALTALALLGFTACDEPVTPPTGGEGDFELSQTSLAIKVGETAQLTATATVDKWESNDEAVATVADGLVTAVGPGNAIISATANGVTKTCVVLVTSLEEEDDSREINASQIWPIILDEKTTEKVASKIVASFSPDDVGKFLYIWGDVLTYNDNSAAASGLNFFETSTDYLSLIVADQGWAGAGYCLTADGTAWQDAEALRAAIVADPDSYFLHIAIRSTDNFSHCFYFMGSEATKFVLGKNSVYDGPVYKDFTRDGEWHAFDIPMSAYAAALADTKCNAGVNVFVMLSEGTKGAILNLDAVYFYKK